MVITTTTNNVTTTANTTALTAQGNVSQLCAFFEQKQQQTLPSQQQQLSARNRQTPARNAVPIVTANSTCHNAASPAATQPILSSPIGSCVVCLESSCLLYTVSPDCSHPAKMCKTCLATWVNTRVSTNMKNVCYKKNCPCKPQYDRLRAILDPAALTRYIKKVSREQNVDDDDVSCSQCNSLQRAGGELIVRCRNVNPPCDALTCRQHLTTAFSNVKFSRTFKLLCSAVVGVPNQLYARYRLSLEDVARREQRHKDFIADERLKAEKCRLCNACGRVIERIAGCASMVCGADVHGGNRQSGCGASLNWDTMPRYQEDPLWIGAVTSTSQPPCSVCNGRDSHRSVQMMEDDVPRDHNATAIPSTAPAVVCDRCLFEPTRDFPSIVFVLIDDPHQQLQQKFSCSKLVSKIC